MVTTSLMCQRWTGRRLSWALAAPGERFDARLYEVHPVDEAVAKAYILANHYSGTYPAASRRYGLFRGGALVGVAVYSVPAQVAVLSGPLPDLEPYRESLELGRLVLDDAEPGNAESWFVARCHEYLLAAGVRGVVSFADPVPRLLPDGSTSAPGHVGWIYQAGGAVYTGRGRARTLTLLPDGSVFSDRARAKVLAQHRGHEYAERQLIALGARAPRAGEQPATWLAAALADVRATQLRHGGNHRYVFALGRPRVRTRIALAALPYPKAADLAGTVPALAQGALW